MGETFSVHSEGVRRGVIGEKDGGASTTDGLDGVLASEAKEFMEEFELLLDTMLRAVTF